MNILIVDDENLARSRLSELVQKVNEQAIVQLAENGNEAVEIVNKYRPDIVLMDIRMPVMDGLEAAMHISNMDEPPAVIFTTAHDEHALEAFEVNAIDYLLKPIRRDRLAAALEKAHQLTHNQLNEARKGQPDRKARSHISINLRGQINLIPLTDIIYFMADNKYVQVRTSKDRYIIEDALVNLENEFSDIFLRVHRNALVSVNYIRGLEKQDNGFWSVLLQGIDDKLDVSRRHTASVRRWIRQT